MPTRLYIAVQHTSELTRHINTFLCNTEKKFDKLFECIDVIASVYYSFNLCF